jgi:hypothetical protein
MRWKRIKKAKTEPFSERVVTRFLVFPKTLEDETRWLEKTGVVQVYQKYTDMYSVWYFWTSVRWEEATDEQDS